MQFRSTHLGFAGHRSGIQFQLRPMFWHENSRYPRYAGPSLLQIAWVYFMDIASELLNPNLLGMAIREVQQLQERMGFIRQQWV